MSLYKFKLYWFLLIIVIAWICREDMLTTWTIWICLWWINFQKILIARILDFLYLPLVKSFDVFLPPLHIKLGVINNFVKTINRNGNGFLYLKKSGLKTRYLKKNWTSSKNLQENASIMWLLIFWVTIRVTGIENRLTCFYLHIKFWVAICRLRFIFWTHTSTFFFRIWRL